MSITPALYFLSEQKQDDDGPVPGGYVVYIVFEQVKGTRLANEHLVPTSGRMHTSLSRYDRRQRARIRAQFEKKKRKEKKNWGILTEMRWVAIGPWVTSLIWDDEFGSL